MKGIVKYFLILALMLPVACQRRTGLEKMAMNRLPVALDKAVREQLPYTDVRVEKPFTLYDCDSLCVIQCEAIAKDPRGEEVRFPVRYAFLLDVVMSAAHGHRIYCESVTGSAVLDEDELQKTVEMMAGKGSETYYYYVAASTPIEEVIQ